MSLILILALAIAPMADPAQEARAQALEQEIRCVACQNEPISQSTADIATDMRRLVRDRIAAGDSDAEIRAFFRERYGDFVLFRPPMDERTWVLWLTPVILAAAGLGAVFASRKRTAGEPPLVPEEGER